MKRIKWLVIFLGLIALIIGIGVKQQMDKQEQLRQEMIKIVESEEAQNKIIEVLKNIDSSAFSDEGIIQSFQVDYDSLELNPMGGVFVKVIVNNDVKLSANIGLRYDSSTGKLESPGQSYSKLLNDLIKESNHE